MMLRVVLYCGVFLCVAPFIGCSSEQPTPSTASGPGSTDARLIGQWNLDSKQTLENGHDVTANNTYDFHADGTFTNASDVQLLNGDTGEPFYTQSTQESGTWTVDGDRTCWTTEKAELTKFKTYTDLISRETIESGLAEESPPECWTIESANAETITLKGADNGVSVTLRASGNRASGNRASDNTEQ